MIFRRYEVKARSIRTGEDLIAGVPPQRFFTRGHAESTCRMLNTFRLLQGAKAFEYYVHDRKA